MNFVASIEKKRDGAALSALEIESFVTGARDRTIPDYQLAAMLMAICCRGMNVEETAALTAAMTRSGRIADLSSIAGVKVDKHSTGGVGDKISLPLAPAVAACGGFVPMISGRSLGHTGGTLDKLESIPGFRVGLSEAELRAQVAAIGLAFGAATPDLAPADKVLYALRDASGAVPSIPLITSSILSKKVASGISALVLDVKTGAGAFLPRIEDSRALARSLVDTATSLGVTTVAWITDMDAPLGRTIGNALEIDETHEVLRGGGPTDVVELVTLLGGEMLALARIVRDVGEGRARITKSLKDGSALAKWRAAIRAQGGDERVLDDSSRLPRASLVETIVAPSDGFVTRIDARALGDAATALGAGRTKVEDRVDPAVGIVLEKTRGERVARGETLCVVHANDPSRLAAVRERIAAAFEITDSPAARRPLAIERVAMESQSR